jgi:hypothetical protein
MILEINKEKIIKEIETQIDKYVDDIISRLIESEKVNRFIIEKIDFLFKNKIITQEHVDHLYRRADHRTFADFFVSIRETYMKEEKTVLKFVEKMKKKGHVVIVEDYGNDDKGRCRLLNYGSKPDKKMKIDGETGLFDFKNLNPHNLKKNDLREYVKNNSGIIAQTNGIYWIYSSECVKWLYNLDDKYYHMHPEWKKLVIEITAKRKEKLMEKGYLKKI